MLHLWKDVEHKEYRKKWTDADTEYIIKNHKAMTVREMAEVLKFKIGRVGSRLHKLRVAGVIERTKLRKLEQKEKDYILKNKNRKTIQEIAKELDRSPSTIRRFLRKEGF